MISVYMYVHLELNTRGKQSGRQFSFQSQNTYVYSIRFITAVDVQSPVANQTYLLDLFLEIIQICFKMAAIAICCCCTVSVTIFDVGSWPKNCTYCGFTKVFRQMSDTGA